MGRYIALMCLLLTAFSRLEAHTADPDSTKGPQFYFFNNDRAHDVGNVPLNTSVTYYVQFRNTGDEPLVITNIATGPADKTAPAYAVSVSWPQLPVRPGRKGLITVTFNSFDAIGSFSNRLLVTSNAAPANFPLLYITGAIVPATRDVIDHPKDPDFPIEFLLPAIIATSKK